MRKSTLHRISIVVAAVALGSAVIATDAVAAGGNAGGHGGWGVGGGHFGAAVAGGRFGGGFGAGRFEHRYYGPRGYYPFGYYDGYGDYGSSSNNGCVSLDAYGCEE